ncbi:hypothetical protein M918_07815 [Clostridium sp. BL8]|uniref:S8 family peptidase n=1 Tax=Clostridium sp. BL8 TaxID=1354301 RepID=UPI00038A2906|nr:S8 family serine peptidase [Clostridium sp. BL8]EQB87749.1 hypothetical protein M918_07815 [Clostridium sp. BL8]
MLLKKNNGVGIAGVADGVKIVPLKVVNKNGKAHIMDVVRAIYWAIENNVHIINLSMGVEVISSDEMNLVRLAHINALKVAISKAIENSIIIISSAGNNGEDSIDFPASLNSVIAVGSVGVHKVNDTFILEKSEFNNSGKKDIIYAPGEDIYTTFINNTYSHTKGTSIAAGFVTGIVAYMKLIDPKLNQEKAKELIFKSAHIISNHKEEIPFINADNIMISMWREKVNK